MTDVHRLEGPGGTPPTAPRKDRSAPDDDKFKKEMQHKVEKISETDAEQQKKRKRPEETEEEEAVPMTQPTPPGEIAPFSLEAQKQEASPFALQSPEGKISPLASAQPTEKGAGGPAAGAFAVPSADEIEDDSGMWGETADIQESPTSSEEGAAPPAFQSPTGGAVPSPPPQPTAAEGPPPAQSQTQPGAQPVPSGTQQPSASDKKGALKPAGVGEKEGARAAQPLPRPSVPQGSVASQLESSTQKPVEDTTALFAQMAPEQQKEKGGKALEEAGEVGAVAAPAQFPVVEGVGEAEKKKVVEEGQPVQTELGLSLGQSAPPADVTEPLAPPPPYTALSAQVLDVYERMVGVMTVMTTEGVTETTVTLNSPQFASSVFYGTQITIREYSTAPRAFNIQINGTPQAVAAFQGNTDDLMAAFQHGNYNFRVNRLETGHLGDRPLFRRKEKVSGEKQDDTGP